MFDTSSILTKENEYHTHESRKAALASLCAELVFYPVVFSVIIAGSRLGKRGLYTSVEWSRSSLRLLRAMEAAGGRFHIENMGVYKSLDGPCVFVGNHMSTLETFTLPCLINPFQPMTFVIKKSLSTVPVFRHLMNARNPIVVSRTNPREDLKTMLTEGTANLKNGTSVVIFPQTTRSSVFDPASFNSIGVKLAQRAQVPVIPIALKTDAMPNGKLIKDFGKLDTSKEIHFAFGDPLQVHGNAREIHMRIIDFIVGKLNQWQ